MEEKIESLVNLLATAQGITSTSETIRSPEVLLRAQSPSGDAQLDEAATRKMSCAGASKGVRAAWTSAAQVFSSSEQIIQNDRQSLSELSPIAAISTSYEDTSSGLLSTVCCTVCSAV